MITSKDIYEVLVALVPLYTSMLLGYSSVRWWKIFTPEHCTGINRFVAMYAIPFLSFNFLASNNIYAMNLQFLAADCLQKIVVLFALVVWKIFGRNRSTEWMITLFSLCSLPNTLIMGVPLLRAMYGEYSVSLMIQLLVTQSILWKTLLIFLYEYREAMLVISGNFPDSASPMSSDVATLSREDQSLQPDVQINVQKDSATNESDQTNQKKERMPSAGVITRLVLIMVWKKLVKNPNTFSSVLGLTWSLISFKWKIQMPRIVIESILVFSRSGLGMCMFSLGLFMASQPKIVNCRLSVAVFSLAVRFLTAPAVMAATAYVVGIRGVLLHIAIIQGALPQAILSFVYAKEYNCHAEILSTAVSFGMLLSLPMLMLYNVLLEL